MNKQRPSTAMLIAFTYLVRVATCSDQHTETDLGTYMNRLKAYTKVCEDQKSSFSTEQFTALSVTKEWITIQETLEIYQSLFEVPDQDDEITVLTIRNNHLAETDGIEECIGYIVTAAQNHIYENRSETALDDMCVTIECIDRENIQDCDAMNKSLGKIEKAKNDVAAYFLHDIIEIIHCTLTQLISNQIDHSLSRYFFFEFDDKKYVSGDGKIDFKATRRDFLKFVKKKILELVEKFSSLDLSNMVSKKQVHKKYSILSFMRSYIVKYEDENNISYFNDDAKLIKEFIRHIIDEHEYLLDGAIKFFVTIFSHPIEQIENENMLNEILEYTHKEMVRVSNPDKNYNSYELGEHLGNICIQLKEDSKFVSLRKAFFEKISLDSQQIAKMVETFHTEKNDLFKCLHADNVAQIILRGKLDEIKLWRICNVLRSTCMIKNLIGHQSIHIDFGREMNEEELKTSFAKYKTRCKDLASEIAITDANFEEIHVYTTAKPKHEEMANNALMLQTYKTDTKIVKEHEACTINTLSVSIANTTQVTVETYEDQKSCFEFLSCISSDVSEITSLHVINIVNEIETIVIYVTQNVTNSLSTEQISVFYDMSKSKKEKENQTISSGSSIKSIIHAPTNIIKDLIHYIQLLQLTLGKKFIVPNIVSVSKFDVLFTDQIYNKPSTSMTNFTSDYLKQFKSCGSRNDYRKYVAKSHIINFLGLGGKSMNSGMREPAQVLGIDTIDFYEVLYEFLMRRHIRNGATKFKHDFYLCSKKNNIVLLTTRHDDGFKVLKICEQNESKYSNSLVIQSSNTFRNILNDQKNYQLLKCFDYIARTLIQKMSFAARVIIEVCKAKSISDTCSGIVDRSKEVTKYVDMFLDMIKALPYQNSDAEFAGEHSTTNENDPLCPSDSYPSFLQQNLTINNVKMMITRIVDYIHRYTSTREINITSIILSKETKVSAGRRDASMLRGANDKLVWNAKHLHDDE